MIQLAIMCAGIVVGLMILKTILKSKTLLVIGAYLGGYVYYNGEWPSVDKAMEHLKALFMMM